MPVLADLNDPKQYKIFSKKILPPKDVHVLRKNDKGETETVKVPLTADRIDKWIENHKKIIDSGRLVPAPFRHDIKANPTTATDLFFREGPPDKKDTDAYQNAGYWVSLGKDKDGVLEGKLAVPVNDDLKKIGTTIREVSPLIQREWVDGDGVKYDDVITHIAVVTHPNIGKQSNFVPDGNAIALSLEEENKAADWAFVALSNEPQDPMNPGKSPSGPGSSCDSCPTAIQVLSDLGLSLPTDTSPENFVERVVVAGRALLELKKKFNDNKAPGGAKEQPLILLSLDEGLSLSLPEKDGVDWGNFKAGFTSMAKSARSNYLNRVKVAVVEGRIPATFANSELVPMTRNLALSLDEENNCIDVSLEKALSLFEKLPKGTALTGMSVTQVKDSKRNKGLDPLSLSLGNVQDEEDLDDETDPDEPPTNDDQADKVVDRLFKNTRRMPAKK